MRAYESDQNAWWKPVIGNEPPPVGESIFIFTPMDDEDMYGHIVQVTSVERNWDDTCWVIRHNFKGQHESSR